MSGFGIRHRLLVDGAGVGGAGVDVADDAGCDGCALVDCERIGRALVRAGAGGRA
jgi:hypothetical protein